MGAGFFIFWRKVQLRFGRIINLLREKRGRSEFPQDMSLASGRAESWTHACPPASPGFSCSKRDWAGAIGSLSPPDTQRESRVYWWAASLIIHLLKDLIPQRGLLPATRVTWWPLGCFLHQTSIHSKILPCPGKSFYSTFWVLVLCSF